MNRKAIEAKDGKILTNGEIYGTKIYLAVDMDEEDFKEISIEEYREIMEEKENEIQTGTQQ